ncbi:hypothetical protein FRAAL3337 [Frankia alni ACN14a]|uniref:Uncharacterized protein n=1 Tax=Frankia alni (strain DSM 45986 / CECT 9034 / ACN14a) TaxID=326424 RepID=Q0RKH7_FRAAA|nr:hypothetical protein [Frankia sp. ACN10a]CAJ61981.1 hypothetical protein FRAAL3337 [Frankia alni ACN14a]
MSTHSAYDVPGHPWTLRRRTDGAGDAFVAGVACYLGARTYTFEDRLHVMPVDTIWPP